MLAGHMRVAERYIVYRAERALLRAREEAPAAPAAIPLADGVEWDGADLRERIAFASIGLDIETDGLERELRRAIRPGIARADLQRLVVLNAKALMERDSEYSRFAGRILLTYVYEETLGWDIVRDGIGALKAAHERALGAALRHGVKIGRIDPRLLRVRPDEARRRASIPPPTSTSTSSACRRSTTATCWSTRRGAVARRIEAPQLFWLRVAMGVCLAEAEDERDARALDLYAMYRQRRFCSSTPTLFNAGTLHSQLSSLLRLQDRGHAVLDRRARHRRERDVLEVGRRPRRLVDGGARDGLAHRVHQRRVPGRRAVPEDAQRPAGRGQPGRQAGRVGLRLPRGLAQRHPRVPRAAAQHRRRAPAHARHEHRVLDPGPVHAARRGARAVDAVPLQRRPGPARDLRGGVRSGATSPTRSGSPPASCTARRSPRSSSGSRCSRCSSRPGTRG